MLVVGGWADAYTNAVPRLLEKLPGPRRGIIGPWGHIFPERGVPGPAVGFLQECVRWFEQWLLGTDTGVMDEPLLRAWIQESLPPAEFYADRPGRWVSEPSWPPPSVSSAAFALTPPGQHRRRRWPRACDGATARPRRDLGGRRRRAALTRARPELRAGRRRVVRERTRRRDGDRPGLRRRPVAPLRDTGSGEPARAARPPRRAAGGRVRPSAGAARGAALRRGPGRRLDSAQLGSAQPDPS